GGRMVGASLFRRAGEQHEIAVRVLYDEVARAPWHPLQRLEERHAGSLEFEKELLDLFRGVDACPGRKQPLAVPQLGVKDGTIDVVQNERRPIARDMRIERRLAIQDRDLEAELLGIEIARRLDVGDEQLRVRGGEDGLHCGSFCSL